MYCKSLTLRNTLLTLNKGDESYWRNSFSVDATEMPDDLIRAEQEKPLDSLSDGTRDLDLNRVCDFVISQRDEYPVVSLKAVQF